MGDKSPKSKQRNIGQKIKAKAEGAAQAQSKQDGFTQVKPLGTKPKP